MKKTVFSTFLKSLQILVPFNHRGGDGQDGVQKKKCRKNCKKIKKCKKKCRKRKKCEKKGLKKKI